MKTTSFALVLAVCIAVFVPIDVDAQRGRRAVTFFADANFCGESFSLNCDWSAAHSRDRWNDAIASIIVPRGWEVWLYEHANFRGASRVIYDDWSIYDDPWWRCRISSVRLVRTRGGHRGGRGDHVRYPRDPLPPVGVTIYEHDNFSGASLNITRDWSVRYTDDFWNDRISSIDVHPGYVVVIYEHANFRGRSAVLEGPWTIRRHRDFWNDQISSIEVRRL